MAGMDAKAAGVSLAGVIGGWYVVCAAAAYAFPDAVGVLGRGMFHGVVLQPQAPTLGGFAVGLVAWVAFGLVTGAAFAKIYNQLSRQ